MSLTELVLAQALLLTGTLEETQTELLTVLCNASVSSLTARLREGLTPEDCKADFVAAAGLLAVAALNTAGGEDVKEFRAGDLTVKRSSADAASRCLRQQAQWIIGPYLQDRFAFRGV